KNMNSDNNNHSGKYACVVCIEDNGEESQIVVPSAWVDEENKIVHWSTSLNARREFETCANPSNKWPTYHLVKTIFIGEHSLCKQVWEEYSTSTTEESPIKQQKQKSPEKEATKLYPKPPPRRNTRNDNANNSAMNKSESESKSG
uniref:Uncharacterized protein n=1 Tax=Clytia hemisphaerica TaxID=252671 RepID=A0A7M5V0A6_9CNID